MSRVVPAFLLLAVLIALLCGCPGPAPPRVFEPDPPPAKPEPEPDPAPGPEIGMVEFGGRRFTVCTVNLDEFDLELFWRDENKEPFKTFAALDDWLQGRGRTLVFAMNAGMYQEDFTPCGLYVEGGDQLHALNLAEGSSNFCMKPNGVFMVTEAGAAVVESTAYKQGGYEPKIATQSGPMLVINGELHPNFGANSSSRYYRNGVGVVDPRTVVFAISNAPVNFHEFAVFFRDHLHCDNALYLDGTISCIYSVALGRNDQKVSVGPIIGVTQELQ